MQSLVWESPISPFSQRPIQRKAVWLTDCKCKYKYSELVFDPHPLPPWFTKMQEKVFEVAGVKGMGLNSCNANYYPDGHHHLDWHSDNEPLFGSQDKGRDVPILSLSIGAGRMFLVKHLASGKVVPVQLHSGDLLFMGGALQSTHKHKVPKSQVPGPRLNFTWRRIVHHTDECIQCGLCVDT